MKTILATAALAFLTAPWADAHEGHDHDAPTTIQAPKGGVVKSLEKTHVELVTKGNSVTLHLYDKELKPVAGVEDYKVSAQAELPRKKGSQEVKLTRKGSSFEGSFDAKGSHRYTLVVAVKDPKTGHDDKLRFTVEPRK